MQIFVPFVNTVDTAKILDQRRLNKQIIECRQVLKAIDQRKKGEKAAWMNHPVTIQYENYTEWLNWYTITLEAVFRKNDFSALLNSEPKRPPFIGDDSYHKQHRRRLYDKDNNHYDIFKDDMSTKEIENKVNYYCIPSNNGGYNIVKYLNGKKI